MDTTGWAFARRSIARSNLGWNPLFLLLAFTSTTARYISMWAVGFALYEITLVSPLCVFSVMDK